MKLGEMSLDKEAKFYTFESKVHYAESEGAKKRKLEKKIIIDSPNVQNETAIFNSSYNPNCTADIVYEQMGDFEIAAVEIWTGEKSIKAGTDLTFNYQWENTACYCFDNYKKPPIPVDFCSKC